MLERVRHEVVHDALDLARIDLGDDRGRRDLDHAAFRDLDRGDGPLHERRDVRPRDRRVHEAVPEPIDVEQVGEQVLEALSLRDELARHLASRFLVLDLGPLRRA